MPTAATAAVEILSSLCAIKACVVEECSAEANHRSGGWLAIRQSMGGGCLPAAATMLMFLKILV